MADEELGPYSPIVSVRRGRNQLPDEDRALLEERRRRRHAPAASGEREGGRGGPGYGREDFHDDISVLGIPKEEMTENVRHAIDRLLEEINRLRAELMNVRGHEAYLEEQAEKDRLLHVMRRRAFVARLNLAARRVAEEAVPFSLVYIAITNARDVRGQMGHGAAEHMMMQAAEVLRESAIPGDVVGSLENFDFGVLLPGAPLAAARERGRALVAALNGRSFVWQHQPLNIDAACGAVEIAPDDSDVEILERARRDLANTGGGESPGPVDA